MEAPGAQGAGIMKGSVKRDVGAMAKMRKAKPKVEAAQNAPKRLKFDVAYHGTDAKSAAAIKRGSFRESAPLSLAGQGVYATRSRREAKDYANQKGEKNWTGAGPGEVKLRIPRGSRDVMTSKMSERSSRGQAAKNAAEKARVKGKGIYFQNSTDKLMVMPAAVANKAKKGLSGVISGSSLRKARRRK
jgi:hypothetical protein